MKIAALKIPKASVAIPMLKVKMNFVDSGRQLSQKRLAAGLHRFLRVACLDFGVPLHDGREGRIVIDD